MNSTSPSQDHSGADTSQRPKRRKIAVACDECRVRKVRCDGVQPACGPCSKRVDKGAQCRYTGEPEKKRAAENYITTLENRIKALEGPGPVYVPGFSEANGFRGWGHDSIGTPTQQSGPTETPRSQSSLAQATPFHRPNSSFGALSGRSPSSGNLVGDSVPLMNGATRSARRTSQPTESADGINAMMGAVEERPSQEFFGSSSAASFMRQIKTAVDKKVSSPQQDTADPANDFGLRGSFLSPQRHRTSAIHDYVLPSRKTADSLMNVYWHYVFPLYPLVDSIQLREEYARLWTGEGLQSDENMLMCIFNVIFALACQLADFITPEERETSAASFFSRAKDLLHFSLWDSGSAGLIQCLLLMAQYLQSTNSAHQCWIVTGLAVRNAQSMGLHLPQTISRLQSPQEQQLARKIWHGCVLMDRVISMTFGRPAMISKASAGSVPLPVTIDEEYFASASGVEVAQPTDQPSIMSFYAKSLELYEILNDILLSLYKPTPEEPDDVYGFSFNKDSSERELTIFELDRALTSWTRSLPPHLRGELASGSNANIFYRQSVVLRARFLHVRMLLFRPILSKYCTSRDAATDPLISLTDSFPQRVALQCSIICVNVARDIIDLIYGNIPSDGTSGPLPAWWYNILYVYTAATVIIASRLCPPILEEVTEAVITRSWNYALEILRKYQSYSTSARRCVAALEILYERAVTDAPIGDNQPQSQPGPLMANSIEDMSLGEGMNPGLLDSFDLPDFGDMSWLHSVPSHLY
ncbi:transcription factor domain-containing protein [Aspergillus mulundensis]|uniref:Putative Zn(II)2Cys6 transcription factor n=1 Tax=Aspergillus mulundensis TaxID=1810919 RepID=A0A3D8RSJ0_9EURO|nr:putative Zn(II)2Cys6 transcription factor [Aspergillus mulundensis]RDW76781.1 putative Zn(II)2Cys6 transcription factor [Aspergillus mulundensis]